MARIGLKAIRISEGLTNLFEINGDPSWISKVRDVRSDLKCIENIQLGKHYLMLTNIEDGFLLSIIIPIGGREGDCFNVSLFIPKITENTTCVEKIIDEVETQFKNGRFNKERLQEVVDTCGIKLSNAERVVNQSKGDVVAYRVIKNKEDRVRLLGALNQKDYSEYKMVMILNEEDIAAQRCVDLTNKVIKEEVVVKAPQKIKGFKPYIYGKLFDKDMWLEKGSKVDVVWKCDNYKNIIKTFEVGVGEVEPLIVRRLSEFTIICRVTNQWEDGKEERLDIGNEFKISNDNYDVWIKPVDENENLGDRYIIENNNTIAVVYEDVLEEKIEIKVTLDLTETEKQLEKQIDMNKRKELKIEDKTFVLKSDKDDISFKNFEVIESNGTKELKVKDKPKKKVESESKGEEPKVKVSKVEWLWRLVSFFVGVLVAVLVVLAGNLSLNNQKNVRGSSKSISIRSENKSAVAPKDTSDVNVACINYLKTNMNKGWSKDSLESYSLTRGLYDAMINYKFDEMKRIFDNIFSARTDKSKKGRFGNPYDGIVKWVNANKDSKKEKVKDKKFDVGSENKINLKNYLEKLNEISDNKSKPSDIESQNSVLEENKDSIEDSMNGGEDRNDIN